jgi:hypothetical protein
MNLKSHFSSNLIENIDPTFILRGLKFKEVLKRYQKGEFSKVNSKKSIKIAQGLIFENKIFKNDNRFFVVKDKFSSDIIMFRNDFRELRRCFLCLRDFEGEILGYPVAYKEISKDNKLHYLFFLEGNFCSFECALGFLISFQSSKKDLITLLNFLFSMIYPEEKVIYPRRDPRIYYEKKLDEANIHVFRPTSRVTIERSGREFFLGY